VQPAVSLDELSVQQVASRALDRCAAGASTWTVHDVQEHVTRIITEAGVRAEPDELRDLIAMTTRLAAEDCLSVLPPDAVHPEHVAHLTSLHVVAVETRLRDILATRAMSDAHPAPDVARLARRRGLDPGQALRTTATRYFVDPSIGTAALGVVSNDLLNDLAAARCHFEALVTRELRIYAQPLGGRADTWRDEDGHEVDAIVTTPGGRWAAVEIKMSQNDVDRAAAALLSFAQRIDTGKRGQPAALIVVTATGSAGRRPDGVNVVPITALAPDHAGAFAFRDVSHVFGPIVPESPHGPT